MEMTIGQVLHIAGGARINGDKRGLAMTDVTAPDVVALARRFIEAIPHSRALGMQLELSLIHI